MTNGLVLYFVDIYYLSNIGFELNVKSDEIIIISFYFWCFTGWEPEGEKAPFLRTEPVKLTPAWEATNLPNDTLNLKGMNVIRFYIWPQSYIKWRSVLRPWERTKKR